MLLEGVANEQLRPLPIEVRYMYEYRRFHKSHQTSIHASPRHAQQAACSRAGASPRLLVLSRRPAGMYAWASKLHIQESDDEDDERADTQRTLLHSAAMGDVSNLNRALQCDARIDELDECGFNAFHRASSGGHKPAVALLLESKADVNCPDANGCTALHHTCTVGSVQVVTLLLQAPQLLLDAADGSGGTALMACALNGRDEIASLLLQRGAQVNAVDHSGASALMRASSKGHTKVAELLLAHRAAVDMADSDSETALHAASYAGHIEIAALLIRNGASGNITSNIGHTAADTAEARGHVACANVMRALELDATDALHRRDIESQSREQAAQAHAARMKVAASGVGMADAAALPTKFAPMVDLSEAASPSAATSSASSAPKNAASAAVADEADSIAARDELLAASNVAPIDVSGVGGVLKTIVRPGVQSSGSPTAGATVKCRFTVKLLEQPPAKGPVGGEEDAMSRFLRGGEAFRAAAASGSISAGKTVVERSSEPCSVFVLSDDKSDDVGIRTMMRGIHVALLSMRKGEVANLVCRPDFAYGWGGDSSSRWGRDVPADSPVCVLIELLDWSWERKRVAALREAAECKTTGAQCISESRWEAARRCYERAVSLLAEQAFAWPPKDAEDEEAGKLHVACLSNQAMCNLKLQQWTDAAACASAVLAREIENAKALYRRGSAHLELGDPRAALPDLKNAATLEPRSRDVRETYERCKKLVAADVARDRQFGSKIAEAMDGYHDDVSAEALAAEMYAEMETRKMKQQVREDRQYYEDEKTIADARLDENEGNLVMDPEQNRIRLMSMMQCGGKQEDYSWGQSESEIRLIVPVHPHTQAKHVRFEVYTNMILLFVRDPSQDDASGSAKAILNGELFAPVIADGCTYQIEREATGLPGGEASGYEWRLMVSLTKATRTKAREHWTCVVKGEPEIDVDRFGDPVEVLNENWDEDVTRYERMVAE